MSGPEVFIVVAAARNGVIGRDNDLPWRISSDLKHFKAMTIGRPIVMGRRTFQSIGRALPGRTNIVISRDPSFEAEGVTVVGSLAAALEEGQRIAAASGADGVAVTGGGEIYAQALSSTSRIELTEVQLDPPTEGAVRFPDLDPAEWVEVRRVAGVRGDKDEADFAFVTLRRR